MISTGKRCKADTKRGKPCGAWAVNGSDFCFWHDPARVEERRAARAKGGKARHARCIGNAGDVEAVAIESAADTLPILAEAINAVRGLENSIARGRCIGYLCGVVIKAFEVTELEARVAVLEQQAIGGK